MKAWSLGYDRAKVKAKRIYTSIGRIRCDALGGEYVAFTNVGFTHLMRKGRVPRARNEQKRRFVLVPLISEILENPKATIEYRKTTQTVTVNRHGQKTLVTSTAEFWTFVEKVGDCTVKVVIRQLDTGGIKHFFSVMGDNVHIKNGKKRKSNKKTR